MEIRYKTRNGQIVTAKYDSYELKDGERWVSTKKEEGEDGAVHHFVINEEGAIVKGFGGKFNGLKPNEISNPLVKIKSTIQDFIKSKKAKLDDVRNIVNQIPNGTKIKLLSKILITGKITEHTSITKNEQGWIIQGTQVSNEWASKRIYNDTHSASVIDVEIMTPEEVEKEKHEKMYPKEIAGVSQGKPMTHEKADSGNVNPNFDKGGGYETNCQSCVVAYEMRLRGYDVEVLERKKYNKLEDLAYCYHRAWVDENGISQLPDYAINHGIKNPKTCLEWMENTVKQGERYVFRNAWKGVNYGHVRILQRDENGNLWMYDPQNDRSYKGDELTKAIQAIKVGRKNYTTPQLLRIDNKIFSEEYRDKIVKGKNK